MTQSDHAVPRRGERPQLFGGSIGARPRQPDFGPSILATIDGTAQRDVRRRAHITPLKRVVWMSLLALCVVTMYFVVKFGMLSNGSMTSPSFDAQPVVAAQAAERARQPAAVQPSAAMTADAPAVGAASIENVASVASAPAASAPATAMAASLNGIHQTLARSEPASSAVRRTTAPAREVAKPTTKVRGDARQTSVAARPAAPAAKPVSTKSVNDDADLLAAMLPHLKRRGTAPTSPAYERRCGRLEGEAAGECRAKFCNGREGVDAACPSAVR